MAKRKPTTVREYIQAAPPGPRKYLRELRAILKNVAPRATEMLKWGSPAFEEGRILFAYAAFKSHVNLVVTRPALKPFDKELKAYVTGKDSVRFSYDIPLPKALIRKIAAYRVKQVRQKDARWMY